MSSRPVDIQRLVNLLADISHGWELIGIALGIGHSVLQNLRSEANRPNVLKLNDILYEWTVKGEDVSYNKIINAIEGNIVGNREKAKEIREFLNKQAEQSAPPDFQDEKKGENLIFIKDTTEVFEEQMMKSQVYSPDNESTKKLDSFSEKMAKSFPDDEMATTPFEHNDHSSFSLFCETCQEFVCSQNAFHIHKDHKCNTITDSYNNNYELLETALNSITKKHNDVKMKLAALANREKEIRLQEELVKKEINLIAEEMIDAIQQSRKKLLREVEYTTFNKLQVVSSQKKAAEVSLKNLSECKEDVKKRLEKDTQHQILSSTKNIMEQMNCLMNKINAEDYKPLENCDIQLIKNKKKKYHIGQVVCSTSAVSNCKVKKINFRDIARNDTKLSFPLSIELQNSCLLTVPPSSLSCNVTSSSIMPITTTVATTNHPGVYKIHCTPIIRGRLKVIVHVDEVQLESIAIMVPFNPHLDTITPTRTIEEFYVPYGIAVSNDGHVIVSERKDNHLTILDKDGKKIKSFASNGDIKLSSPADIAITPDNFILITDNHKIQKISMDGKLIASVGQRGSKPLEFNYPCGITILPTTGQIYVVDCDNHRIQILNPDLTFHSSFGNKGSAEGQLQHPHFITIDSQEIIYVSDSSNHRIQKFTINGEYLSHFGTFGFCPSQLKYPRGIANADDLLYVSERDNHRVSVFTTDGKFIRCFGSMGANTNQFNTPFGITFDSEGHLYVCDCDNNRLVVY